MFFRRTFSSSWSRNASCASNSSMTFLDSFLPVLECSAARKISRLKALKESAIFFALNSFSSSRACSSNATRSLRSFCCAALRLASRMALSASAYRRSASRGSRRSLSSASGASITAATSAERRAFSSASRAFSRRSSASRSCNCLLRRASSRASSSLCCWRSASRSFSARRASSRATCSGVSVCSRSASSSSPASPPSSPLIGAAPRVAPSLPPSAGLPRRLTPNIGSLCRGPSTADGESHRRIAALDGKGRAGAVHEHTTTAASFASDSGRVPYQSCPRAGSPASAPPLTCPSLSSNPTSTTTAGSAASRSARAAAIARFADVTCSPRSTGMQSAALSTRRVPTAVTTLTSARGEASRVGRGRGRGRVGAAPRAPRGDHAAAASSAAAGAAVAAGSSAAAIGSRALRCPPWMGSP